MSSRPVAAPPPDPNAVRARDLAARIAELNGAIEASVRFVREAPGVTDPERPGEVVPPPGRRVSIDPTIDTLRRLREYELLRDGLRRELRDLDLGRVLLDDCERAAIEWLRHMQSPEQLLDELVPDVRTALTGTRRPPGEPRSPVELRVAHDIVLFLDRQPNRTLARLEDLRKIPRIDERWLADLLHTGCARVREEEEVRHPVGVLLPLRLETRFNGGILRLRVVPDEPWFQRHDPRTSDGELTALERYVEAASLAATPDDVRIAWGELVAQVSGARAVWLVRTFVTTNAAGEAVVSRPPSTELKEEPAFPRLDGFPDELHVWVAAEGGPPSLVATLTVDHTRLDTSFPDPDAAEKRWWEDWDEAVATGLAAEISLEVDPDDIDVLFVTGLGKGDPSKLFVDQRNEGQLGLIAPGTPTNSVDGAPGASLARSPAEWWEILGSAPDDVERLVSHALTGTADRLGALPGSSEPHRSWNAAMVAGLWPALWGFAGADVWAIRGTEDAAAWALHAVYPEGPFPTLRVGSQPYGLLPATSLLQWRGAKGDPGLEAALRGPLQLVRERWKEAAERRGTVAGASTEQLLDLLSSVPTAPGYRHRLAWPIETWWLVLLLLGTGVSWADLDANWDQRYELAAQLGLDPVRRYGTRAAPGPLAIPLVRPEALAEEIPVGEVLRRLVHLAFEHPNLFAQPDMIELEALQYPMDSLLLRLALRSLQVALGDVGRERLGEAPPPDPEPIARPDTVQGNLERWLARLTARDIAADTAATAALRRAADGLALLADVPEDRLDGLLRATLDAATYRIDPWVTGFPTRRLQDLLDGGSAELRLGAYGWVDVPRPGAPGPTDAGLIHVPSLGQAATATVLRDRAVNDPEASRWDMDLSSRTVRTADRIAEHVRVGAHVAEAMGREVERIVADPSRVATLRENFPLRTEHAGRRTCDGLAVLAANPSTLGLPAGTLAELERLRKAADAYGDLLVAEAVHHIAHRRPEAAGAAMDAAAGLGRPPRLDVLTTPREGRSVATTVVALLPSVTAPPGPPTDLERAEVSPSALADPAAASFVAAQIGGPATWTWTVADTDDAVATATVTLADLGLSPADALATPLADVERLVLERGAAVLGLPGTDAVELSARGGSERYERAARLVGLLGRSPATPEAISEQLEGVATGTDIDPELRTRYGRLRGTAETLLAQLDAQLANTTSDEQIGTADPAILVRLTVAARRWGITPDPPPIEALPPLPDPRVRVAKRARELLDARIAAAPTETDAVSLSREDLLAAMTALASPTGQLAVLSRLTGDDLPTLSRSGTAGAENLDLTWLPVTAAVRERLATLEFHQLAAPTVMGSGSALVAWSNKPDDPWQQDESDERRFVVAYSASTLDPITLSPSSGVAAVLVDRFTELIPATDQTTAAVFGFDAPAARAPQAILLAVPPDLDAGLDAKTILRIVVETRDLAHTRMARPADLEDDVRGLLPSVLLPASGRTAVPLTPSNP